MKLKKYFLFHSLVFSKTQHGVRGACAVVCDRVGFFEKNVLSQKMMKISKKMGKNSLKKVF